MARWEATLDHLLETYLFYNGETGRSFVEGFARVLASEAGADESTLWRRLPDRIEAMAFNAEPIYVEPDMMQVVRAAQEGFQRETLDPSDLITQQGFLYLPEPMLMDDVHGKSTSTRAFMWAPVSAAISFEGETGEPTNGIILCTLHRIGDRDDYSFAKDDPRAKGLKADDLLLGHVTVWLFGHDLADDSAGSIRPVLHLLQTLWRLMAQTISIKESTRGDRDERKRYARARFPERSLTVVRLRRPHKDPDPDREVGTVEWTHRWLVRGFWRNQWFPSLGIHRQIYINPYIKGPADRPLEVTSKRIFEFVQ